MMINMIIEYERCALTLEICGTECFKMDCEECETYREYFKIRNNEEWE